MFEPWEEGGAEQAADEQEQDPGSFEDSDRFEEDSLCSYVSETESLCNNWRGWRKATTLNPSQNSANPASSRLSPLPSNSRLAQLQPNESNAWSLLELACRQVARHFPFEVVEKHSHPVAEHLQKRIAFWSFPENDEDIRLYACLANGNAEEFQKGEHLHKARLVKDLLQIGFHLSASVIPPPHPSVMNAAIFNVAVTFDRCRITSCSCTCRRATPTANTTWCAHVVAVCLQRIHQPHSALLRASLSESLERLSLYQLRKFAQYFISELPRQVLPTAQHLLDQLLISSSTINGTHGAPDPTAGPSAHDHSSWCLNEDVLHENIRNLLIKFCVPTPLVCSDVNFLSTYAPPAASEWSNLLKQFRGREPEGMWNLLSIIREMFRRGDNNAVPLLTIVTEECLASEQVVTWWYSAKMHQSGHGISYGFGRMGNAPAVAATGQQSACAGLMDEVATLWRLAVLNPGIASCERDKLKTLLETYQKKCVDKLPKAKEGAGQQGIDQEQFVGFRPAVEACDLRWDNHYNSYADGLPVSLPTGHFSIASNDKTEINRGSGVQGGVSTEVLFMRAEALYVHGCTADACRLAAILAEDWLERPLDFIEMAQAASVADGRVKKRLMQQLTMAATAALTRLTFLISVLMENEAYHLAFRLGLMAIELARPPASSKALEVKMSHQECEIVALLKKIPQAKEEVDLLRQRAVALRDGTIKSRGDALLPLPLALFVFESLSSCARQSGNFHDEELAFDAAVTALGMKSNVSEAEHPLVCEGSRRQRGELACLLLVTYKDDSSRLRKIMHQLLDKDLYKSHRNTVKYSPPSSKSSPKDSSCLSVPGHILVSGLQPPVAELSVDDQKEAVTVARTSIAEGNEVRVAESEDSSALDEDNKDWESKLRCTVFKPRRRHSNSFPGGIDSSAPETTSSDNSPTMIRRFPRLGAKANDVDGGSSGDSSSDSRDSSFRRDDEAGPQVLVKPAVLPPVDSLARSSTPCARNGKRNPKKSPTEPNQPSEAMAHFMFELAKSVLIKAGGDVSNALFQPGAGQQVGLPHRELHMCAYQIGLYALGIQNCVSQNWQSRTYSSHVSWITNQAMELGSEAVMFLIDTWESHLTPSEVAVLADKASRSSDLQMVRAAAELAQSALSYSSALNPSEIQRALAQCKEQEPPMLEQALIAVESSARGGGVCPEALFDVARKWYDMFAEAIGEMPLAAADEGYNPAAVFSNNHVDHPPLHHHQNLMPMAHAYPASGHAGMHIHHQHSPQYPYHHYAPNPAAVLAVLRHHHPYVQQQVGHHGLVQPMAQQRHSINPYYQQVQLGMLIPNGMAVRQPMHRFAHPLAGMPGLNGLVMPPVGPGPGPGAPASASGSISPAVLQYLTSAYRVGMLAMDTLARRLPDGHVNKYSRTPAHADSIKWLVAVSFKLGSQSLLEMCRAVENTVSSPSMLWEIARAAALYLAESEFPHLEMMDADPGTRAAYHQILMDKYLRLQVIQTLIKKSTQMFNLCLRQKLLYIAPADYEDFLSTVEEARKVYSHLANVNWNFQFHNLLTEIREQLAGKRDLLARLNAITGLVVQANVHP